MSGPAADDRCPRCGGLFHCGASDPTPCACAAVTLDAAVLEELRQCFERCLCLDCLRALAAGAPIRPD